MNKQLTIALIAHDRRKADMCDWVEFNKEYLKQHKIICTGTTGSLVEAIFNDDISDYNDMTYVKCMHSGPLGGDAEIAALIVQGKIDMCVFLIDDLSAQPHEADISMLLRQCRIHNIPVACNRYTADLIITSNLWDDETYIPTRPKYTKYERNDT